MAANSLPRRMVKRLLAPVLSDTTYSVLQAAAMGWDIRRGAWTEPELDLIPHAVRSGETAIDIGANFGLYSYHLSRAVGASGKVYSFEPIPFTAATFRLIARALRFRNVELRAKGCGERAGEVTFTVPVMDTGAISAGLVHMGRNDDRAGKETHARFGKTKPVVCPVVAIDEELAHVENVSLIKCDIEGADLYAMRGARKTLEKHKPTVIIEINPWFLEGFGLKVDDVVGFFAELGYACYRYADGKLREVATTDIVEDNWIFVHPERKKRLLSLLSD